MASTDQTDPNRRSQHRALENAKPERHVRPDGSRAHFPQLVHLGNPHCITSAGGASSATVEHRLLFIKARSAVHSPAFLPLLLEVAPPPKPASFSPDSLGTGKLSTHGRSHPSRSAHGRSHQCQNRASDLHFSLRRHFFIALTSKVIHAWEVAPLCAWEVAPLPRVFPGQQRRASLGLAVVSEDLVVCSPVAANALAVCCCWWETCRVRLGKTPKPL